MDARRSGAAREYAHMSGSVTIAGAFSPVRANTPLYQGIWRRANLPWTVAP